MDKQKYKQRLKELKWMMISKEIIYVTHKRTHGIINGGKPEEIASVLTMATRDSRLKDQRKLGTKPKILTKNDKISKTFRNRAYAFNMLPAALTLIRDKQKINENLQSYMLEGVLDDHT